ncbi:carboxymuconolactone decarboxylase family protein [Plantactinospora soyae]|uniref:AhpD family alkylhydroperoxidase n=1 Tax=Plantactinospora soyae TaxID=1544732 RepID=A0A927M5T9_9ACTN|nr:carboxymuconolactone decarboxylase family protein [Plantactinospora soyae]MBE1487527.1 AhpD family alkylhydroperoxidase [Plantactinospora soyae]
MGSLFARVARRASLAHIRHVAPVAPGTETGLVAQVYQQMEADFGMVAPPIGLHAPAPATLAASWLMLRESLLAGGVVGRPVKEAVAAAVSVANRCPYCVEVHGAALAGLSSGRDAAAIVAGRFEAVADPRLRELARWAWASGKSEGAGRSAPFPAGQAPEIIGVVVTFHYINRMVSVFLTESPLPPVPASALGAARRGARFVMGSLARRRPAPGTSLDLLADAPLPPDLSWAAGRPPVAAAFARAAAAFEDGGRRAVTAEVRGLVLDTLAGRIGIEPGLGAPAWLDEAIAAVPVGDRPAARLGLLTAFAPYRVTGGLVDEVRGALDEAGLVQLTSWASFAAARAIGARLWRTGSAPQTGATELDLDVS